MEALKLSLGENEKLKDLDMDRIAGETAVYLTFASC